MKSVIYITSTFPPLQRGFDYVRINVENIIYALSKTPTTLTE